MLIVIGFCFRPTTILMTFQFCRGYGASSTRPAINLLNGPRPAEMLILFSASFSSAPESIAWIEARHLARK